MPRHLRARLATEKWKAQRARIGDIRTEVHEILARPPASDRYTEPVVASGEGDGADEGNEHLEQRSAKNLHELAEGREDDVAGLVKRQVCRVALRRNASVLVVRTASAVRTRAS
jgi:hypothetical protein